MHEQPEQAPANESPDNPMTPLAVGVAQLHEFFAALVASGFSVDQAIYLVAAQMCGGPKGPAQ
jgi:hypothetical protein